jgi:hypothetical protein
VVPGSDPAYALSAQRWRSCFVMRASSVIKPVPMKGEMPDLCESAPTSRQGEHGRLVPCVSVAKIVSWDERQSYREPRRPSSLDERDEREPPPED